jgi:hypothetical protein
MSGGQSKAIRCAACQKRIRGHEPDLILQDLDGGPQRFFHTRCGGAAYAAVAEKLGAYRLTVRHVEEMAN